MENSNKSPEIKVSRRCDKKAGEIAEGSEYWSETKAFTIIRSLCYRDEWRINAIRIICDNMLKEKD